MVDVFGPATQERRFDLRHAPCVQFRLVVGVGSGGALGVGVGAQAVPGVEPGVGDDLDGCTAGFAADSYVLTGDRDFRRIKSKKRAAVVTSAQRQRFRVREDVHSQRVLPV